MTVFADIFDADAKSEFHKALERLKGLYGLIRNVHSENETNPFANGSHGLDHDLAVGAFAHAIGRRYSRSLAYMGLAAALMHSYDRHPRAKSGAETFEEEDVRQWIAEHLASISSDEQSAVLEAVVAHDKPNRGKVTDSPTVGDVLADADKLANIMLYSAIRIGQNAAQKPALRLGNLEGRTPGATYRDYNVALDDLFSRFEWLDDDSWFVTKEAKALAKELDAPLREFIRSTGAQFRAIGLEESL